MIEVLGNSDWRVREAAAKALGNLGDKKAVQPLSERLKDHYSNVRLSAAKALGNLGDKRAVQPLIEALGDSNSIPYFIEKVNYLGEYNVLPNVRQCAAKALGNLGDKRAVQPLIGALGDSDWRVREAAAKALGNLGDKKAVQPLIKALGDSDWDWRISEAAAKALGNLGDKKAVQPLIEALGDSDWRVREAAVRVLGKLGVLTSELKFRKYINDLINSCNQTSAATSSAKALGKLGDKRAIPGLLNALANWHVGPISSEVLQKLGWQPSSDQERVWFNVARRNKQALLGDWKITRSVLLADAATSRDSCKVKNAVYAFVDIGRAEEVLDDLVEILNAKGAKETAEAFLNCGNKHLSDAARNWARNHGYSVKSWPYF